MDTLNFNRIYITLAPKKNKNVEILWTYLGVIARESTDWCHLTNKATQQLKKPVYKHPTNRKTVRPSEYQRHETLGSSV